jgi:outer membrane lipoprotein-sorting protein
MTWKALCPGLLLLIGTAMYSCSPRTAAVSADVNTMPAGVIAGRVKQREAGLASMAGRGSVSFESPERAGSAFFDLSLKKPDSLLMTFEGPFGIGAGFLFLSRQKFVMYSGLDNRVTSGVPGPAAIRSVIPVDLTFDQIMDAFTGGFVLPDAVPARYTVDDGKFLLVYKIDGRTHSYWIDPEYDLVVRYEVRAAGGDLLLEAESSQMVRRDNLCVPRHVTVDFPDKGRRLSIHYTSLDLNAGDLSFVYTVPAGAHSSSR